MNERAEKKIREVFGLLQVSDFRSLSRVYNEKDQELMRARLWDDVSPQLITNRVKTILEQINPAELDDDDRVWWHEILWFWYHHAISHAIWKSGDKSLAQFYASRALKLQMPDHPNKITKLLWLLVHDKLEETKKWTETEQFADCELQTALEIIREYERGEFFLSKGE